MLAAVGDSVVGLVVGADVGLVVGGEVGLVVGAEEGLVAGVEVGLFSASETTSSRAHPTQHPSWAYESNRLGEHTIWPTRPSLASGIANMQHGRSSSSLTFVPVVGLIVGDVVSGLVVVGESVRGFAAGAEVASEDDEHTMQQPSANPGGQISWSTRFLYSTAGFVQQEYTTSDFAVVGEAVGSAVVGAAVVAAAEGVCVSADSAAKISG